MTDTKNVKKYAPTLDWDGCYYEGDQPCAVMEEYNWGEYVHISDYNALLKECEARQAKIDALMLEYEPDAMTPEQFEQWALHQKPV